MTTEAQTLTPGLTWYVKSLRKFPADAAVDHLILLLRRRQISHSRSCAVAATHLYLRVIAEAKFKNSADLLQRIRDIGRRLQRASPHELVLGNITRRVLGLIREVNEIRNDAVDLDEGINGPSNATMQQTLEDLEFSRNGETPAVKDSISVRHMREDVLNGLREMLDEIDQADEQVAGYASEFIHSSETILTSTNSMTMQKFLLNAAKRRNFTVIHVEGYPNEHTATYDTIANGKSKKGPDEKDSPDRLKSLVSAGVNVIAIPESAIMGVMSQVTKVLLPMQIGFPNSSFVGAAGSSIIAHAAKACSKPLIVLGAIYKLSPLQPVDTEGLMESGDPKKLLSYADSTLVDSVDVVNAVSDFVEPELVQVLISNIGAHAPSSMFRVVAEHYRAADLEYEDDSSAT